MLFGGGISFAGFKYGLKVQIEKVAKEEDVKINPKSVLPSGLTPRQLAMKAFMRGSLVALVGTSFVGIGLAFVLNYLTDANWKKKQLKNED